MAATLCEVISEPIAHWRYLFRASLATLQTYELARLASASVFLEQLRFQVKHAAEEIAAATLARTLLECRPHLLIAVSPVSLDEPQWPSAFPPYAPNSAIRRPRPRIMSSRPALPEMTSTL